MTNVYGDGNYGSNNYSAPTNLDAEGSVSVSSSVTNDTSAIWGGIGNVSITASFSADPNHIFGGVATLVPVFSYEADAVVVIEERGEATLVITPQFSAQANVLYGAEASIEIPVSFVLDYYSGPFWNPEHAEGDWEPEPTESEEWVPELPPSTIWTIQPSPPAIPWS
jgi:hypothetical protein